MAHIIPSDYGALEYSTSHEGELAMLKRLQKELSNDYTVFHSLHWSNERPTYTIFGEIDFIILNRSGDILVVEQKDGSLEETDEGLLKHYGRDKKNVAGQLHRNVENVQNKLKKYFGHEARYNIDYLLLLPDYRVVRAQAAGLDPSRILDQSSIGDLAPKIEKILGSGVETDPGWTRAVRNFFNQTFEVVPAVSSHVATQERNYTRMIEGLGDVIDNLDFSPFRLRVLGTAGSGKSQLTIRFFRRALAEGKRPLLVCFNRPLADRLQAIAGDEGTVDSFHGFCTETIWSAGIDVDFGRKNDPQFWRELVDRLYEVEVSDQNRYDCLIVDEGQDFEEEWFEILKCFLTDSASILWLEDPLQNLRGKEPVRLEGFVTYRESANFRSPTSIGDFIKRSLNVSFRQKNPLPGLGVAVHGYAEPIEQEKIVAHRITELQRLGFDAKQIAIVSCHGQQKTVFGGIDQVGQLKIRKFTGEYGPDGRQAYSDGQIYFETIYRFKGQQAPAVIVVDIDDALRDNEWSKRLLYCAMTRATVRLELVAQNNSHWSTIFKNSC